MLTPGVACRGSPGIAKSRHLTPPRGPDSGGSKIGPDANFWPSAPGVKKLARKSIFGPPATRVKNWPGGSNFALPGVTPQKPQNWQFRGTPVFGGIPGYPNSGYPGNGTLEWGSPGTPIPGTLEMVPWNGVSRVPQFRVPWKGYPGMGSPGYPGNGTSRVPFPGYLESGYPGYPGTGYPGYPGNGRKPQKMAYPGPPFQGTRNRAGKWPDSQFLGFSGNSAFLGGFYPKWPKP
jgi:hypothetical protein